MGTITGDAGNNTLYGTTGDDSIYGYAGLDIIHASSGTDYVDGGDGTSDRLYVTISNASLFSAPTGSRTYTITSTTITDSSGSLNTTFTGIERLYFNTTGSGDYGDTIDASGYVAPTWFPLFIDLGNGDDTIIGSAGNDNISVGLGRNTVDAGDGVDVVVVDADSSSTAVLYVTASGATLHTTQNGVVTNTISNAEDIRISSSDFDAALTRVDASGLLGFAGAVVFDDSNGSNISIGSAGTDYFINHGHATVGDDVYTGNGGADTFDYTFAVDGMDRDTIVDFDWDDIIDFRYNDSAYGYSDANIFIGNAAFSGTVGEYRYEIVGNETIVQADTDGDGVANRTLTIANGGFALVQSEGDPNVIRMAGNRVTGDADANALSGTAGVDLIDGQGGADTMTGLGGDDIYYVDNTGDQVTEATGGGADRVNSTVSYTLGANVEMLILTGVRAINATGNALNNTLTGNSASNILKGAGGADSMSGEGGNDTYFVGDAGDVVIEDAAEGIDRVISSISYTLSDNVERLTLTGTALSGTGNALANIITGNSAANTLTGGGGNDTLNGGAGADTMVGGAGNDIYIVANVDDLVSEASGGGKDLVKSSISYTLGNNVERLVLTGTGAISGTGNALSNTITGNAGANVLRGAGGADVIVGGGGADDIYGGNGADILTGGLGADDFFFNTTLNRINVDRIKDFSAAADTIMLDDAVFSALSAGTLAAGAFHAGTSAADADDRIIYDSATGRIYYDADGNGAGAQVLFAQLVAGTAITNADFIAY